MDEKDLSRRKWVHAYDLWDSIPLDVRIEYCRAAGVSIFASRRKYPLTELIPVLLVNA